MTTLHEIIQFVRERTGAQNVNPESDINSELGVDGDDFHELMREYSDKFNVDMDTFLWYFHSGEEGQNLGGIIFDPPYKRVDRIPVTPKMLLTFSETGSWNINYPKHELPKKRYDMIFNRFIGILLVAVMIIILIFKYLK